jgi:hypothetical protein
MERFRKEKPRGGSRGARDTQLFRLVKQDEEVSRSRGYSSSFRCVNSSLQATRFRLTLEVEKDCDHMKNKSLLASLVLCGALAVAAPAFAKPVSTTLPVSHTMKVGQTEIKAGDYRFLIDGSHLTILNGKKQIAEAEGRWEDRDSKASYNSIVSNGEGKVVELRFEGKKSVFVLNQ